MRFFRKQDNSKTYRKDKRYGYCNLNKLRSRLTNWGSRTGGRLTADWTEWVTCPPPSTTQRAFTLSHTTKLHHSSSTLVFEAISWFTANIILILQTILPVLRCNVFVIIVFCFRFISTQNNHFHSTIHTLKKYYDAHVRQQHTTSKYSQSAGEEALERLPL